MMRVGLTKHPISYNSMRELRWGKESRTIKKKHQNSTTKEHLQDVLKCIMEFSQQHHDTFTK